MLPFHVFIDTEPRSVQAVTSPSSCYPRTSAKSTTSILPYILPSSVSSNSFVLTLFSKLPGWGHFPHFPFSLFHFRSPLSPLECSVEHPMKDANPEGESRPKDLNIHVSLLECAVTQNATLSALECAVAKTGLCNSFRMRSYKKMVGVGASSLFCS